MREVDGWEDMISGATDCQPDPGDVLTMPGVPLSCDALLALGKYKTMSTNQG